MTFFRGLLLLFLATTIGSARLLHFPLKEHYPGPLLSLTTVCSIYQELAHDPLIDSHYYFNKVTKRLNQQLECSPLLTYDPLTHTRLIPSLEPTLKKEAYRLRIDEQGIRLGFGDYGGYVYGLQALALLLEEGVARAGISDSAQVVVADISDQARYGYRGLMVDTARHFLSVQRLSVLIQSMAISRLNVLHWHMMDDESFSVQLATHPELAEAAAYSPQQTYHLNDLNTLIALANKNAVQIVPEVSSPTRMRSWVQSSPWNTKNLTINCKPTGDEPKYCHQLDPSKPEGVQLLQEVVAEVDQIFSKSPYLHLGGEGVSEECWDSRPSIKSSFMKLHNIKDYSGLVEYLRFKVKQALPSSRKVIYWIDGARDYSAAEGDILQFKGHSADLPEALKKTSSKVILSPYDVFDLSTGLGDISSQGPNHRFNSWKGIYQNYSRVLNLVDQERLLGAQLLAWGTAINEDNFENSVWMRASAFGLRMWSGKEYPTHILVSILVQVQAKLEALDIDASPVTSQYCERMPERCWPQEDTDTDQSATASASASPTAQSQTVQSSATLVQQ